VTLMCASRLEGDLVRVMGAARAAWELGQARSMARSDRNGRRVIFRNLTGVADLVTSTLVQNGFVDFERT